MSGSLRRRLEPPVRRWWAGKGGALGPLLSALTLPLEWTFRGVSALRNQAFDRGVFRVHSSPVPVISVGNLTVGGTGKTPVASWLAGVLRSETGEPGAVVLRGYGRDEAALHRAWTPGLDVVAHPDRVRAVARAAAAGARWVVADDAFQHRRLGRALDVVLVAAEHALPGTGPGGRLLPRGPYREGLAALGRADAVVVTRKTAPEADATERARHIRAAAPHLLVARVSLAPEGWLDGAGAPAEPPEGETLAVTAIAEPGGLVDLVERVTGSRPELLAFPDHHEYDAADAERIVRAAGPRPVVTTEKDAVKLAALRRGLPPLRVLRLGVKPEEGTEALLDRVRRAVDDG